MDVIVHEPMYKENQSRWCMKSAECLYGRYMVQQNDTLSGIASAHNMTLKKLLSIFENQQYSKNPDLIHPGNVVFVSNTYKVKLGDTLSHIASVHDIDLFQLLSTVGNEKFLDNPDLIHSGDIVQLPGDWC